MTTTPYSTPCDDFLAKDSVRAIGAVLTYDGPMPTRSMHRYQLCSGRHIDSYVYILRDASDRVLYVGKSRNVGGRFDKHRRKHWWGEVASVSMLRVTGEDGYSAQNLAFFLERRAIRHFRPAYNIVGVSP